MRLVVPLKSMCSTKWAMPPRSAVSWRDPRVSQTPMLIDRTCVMQFGQNREDRSREPLQEGRSGEFGTSSLVARDLIGAP